jgi:hypothetical protein
MASFLRAVDPARVSTRFLSMMPEGYPGWEDSVMVLADEREGLAYNERGQTNPFLGRTGSWQVALRVVERVADLFTFDIAEPERKEIKENLLTHERGDTGRVRLADFYRADRSSRTRSIRTFAIPLTSAMKGWM